MAAEDLGESELASPYGKGRVSLLNMPKDQVPSDADLRALGQLGGPLSPLKSRIRERRTKVTQEEQTEDAKEQITSNAKRGEGGGGGRAHEQDIRRRKYYSSEIKGLRDKRPHKSRELEDNAAFGAAMDKWNRHDYKEAAGLFRKHRTDHPDSPWVGETALHLGCEAQFTGRWDEARQYFESILEVAEPGEDIYQKAKLRLAVLALEQGMIAESQEGFSELLRTETDWGRMTYAQDWIRQLSLMKGQLANIRTCGNESLAYVLELRGQTETAGRLKAKPAHGDYGYTLAELRDAATTAGLKPMAVEADVSNVSKMPFPWVAHYADEHFVTVVGETTKGMFRVYDPRLKAETILDGESLAKQWSGLALLLDGQNTSAARPASPEALARMGGCCGVPTPPSNLGGGCDECDPCCDNGGATGGASGGGVGGGASGGNSSRGRGSPAGQPAGGPFGMPTWEINPINMNMVVTDIPMWYEPPYGPSIRIKLTYNSLDSLNELRPFGPKWTFNYASYAMENPNGEVTLIKSHGRRDVYAPKMAAPAASVTSDSYSVSLQSSGQATESAAAEYRSPTKYPEISLRKTGAYDFEVNQPDGTIYVYGVPTGSNSSVSVLKKIRDSYGNEVTINHAPDGKITSIADATGKNTVFEYNNAGYISRITDPFGRFCTFTYDEHDRLIGQTDMGGQSYGYEYTEMNVEHEGRMLNNNLFITAIQKPSGTTTFYTEPADGIVNNSDPYPESGSPMWSNFRITIIDPLGTKSEYHYNGYSQYSWYRDRVQYPHGIENPLNGPQTKYHFYTASNDTVISRTEYADGRYEESWDFNSNLQPGSIRDTRGGTHYYTYNDKGRILTHKYPRGREDAYDYASNGMDIIRYKDRPDSSSEWSILEEHEYNPQGDPIVFRDTAGVKTHTAYNAYGQIASIKTFPAESDNPAFTTSYTFGLSGFWESIQQNGQTLMTFACDEIGRIETLTDADGITLAYEYDDLNRITSVHHADDTSEHTTYDCCHVASITDRQGRVTQYSYDANGWIISICNPLGQVTHFNYDAEGRLAKLEDTVGNPTYWIYDNVGRVIQKVYADGLGYKISYNGDVSVTKINARGQQLTTNFDEHYNITSIHPSGESANYYHYDYRDRLITMNDEIGATNFHYESSPSGRLLQIDGPWDNDLIEYTYDSLGRVSSRSINDIPISIAYDEQGRVLSEFTPLGSFNYTYASLISKRVARMNYPNGMILDIDYKAPQEGLRLASLHYKNSLNETISRFAYDYLSGGGGIRSWTQQQGANNKRWDLMYDKIDQLTDLVEVSSPSGTITALGSWRYDAIGNRRLVQTHHQSIQANHNAINQLLSMAGSETLLVQGSTNEPANVIIQDKRARFGESNRFEAEIPVETGMNTFEIRATDVQGNTQISNYSINIPNEPKQIFIYDKDGNLLQEESTNIIVREYTWDVRNRLKSVTINGDTYTFIYNAMGRRIRELINGSAYRSWLWIDGHQPDEERDATGNFVSRRYFDMGMQVLNEGQAQDFFYIKDHLESIRGIADSIESIQAYYAYDVWGKRETTRFNGSMDADFAFAGHLLHTPSQLNLSLFRIYDSQSGRWLSRDPIEELGGLNLYSRTHNNVINFIDLLGLMDSLTTHAPETVANMASIEGMTTQQYLAQRAMQRALDAFRKQLAKYGKKSLEKSLKSLKKRIQEHYDKLAKDPNCPAANHWKEEILTWETQVNAILQILAGL